MFNRHYANNCQLDKQKIDMEYVEFACSKGLRLLSLAFVHDILVTTNDLEEHIAL